MEEHILDVRPDFLYENLNVLHGKNASTQA